MYPSDSGIPGWFVVLFVLIAIFFVVVIVGIVYGTTRRYRVAKKSGLDPWAGDIQVMAAAKNSTLLAPAGDTSAADADPKARMARLDALLADGTITQDEYQAARQRIVGEL